jgi:hypothetical protein
LHPPLHGQATPGLLLPAESPSREWDIHEESPQSRDRLVTWVGCLRVRTNGKDLEGNCHDLIKAIGIIVSLLSYYYYLNCKGVFTWWQWYYSKTQHTKIHTSCKITTPRSNKTQHTKVHKQ